MAAPREIRQAVHERDGFKCTRCDSRKDVVVHHVLPESEGGTHDTDNLLSLCMPCHKYVHIERGDMWAITMAESKAEWFPKFFTMYQDGLLFLAKHPLAAPTQRVLFYLLSIMDYDNQIRVKQIEIAAELSMRQSAVSRAIKSLREVGILERTVHPGRGTKLRMSPFLAWRGQSQTRKGALAEANRLWGSAK